MMNNSVERKETNDNVVIHEPPPSYIETIPKNDRDPTAPVYLNQNGQFVPVLYTVNVIQLTPPYRIPSKDYLNLFWSIFNTFLCLWPVGLNALVISVVTLNMRRRGEHQNVDQYLHQ